MRLTCFCDSSMQIFLLKDDTVLPQKITNQSLSMLVSNSKRIVYIFQSCRGKFAGGLNYRGEKRNVTFMQSSQTKCHLPTGLALHGELQIARSAAKQKTNLKTNAKNYCVSERLGTIRLFEHGKRACG